MWETIWFILGIALTVGGVIVWVKRRQFIKNSDSSEDRMLVSVAGGIVTFVALFLGLILAISQVTSSIGSKDIGVVTAFGKTVDTFSSGLNFRAPWLKVEIMDGSIQTDTNAGDNCTTVRIADGSRACVDNSSQWQLEESGAQKLFGDFRTFETIETSVVTRARTAALSAAFATFDPLEVDEETGEVSTKTLEELSGAVTENMQHELGSKIHVHNVNVTFVSLAETTQQRLDAFNAEVGNTRVAEQKEKTAKHEANANNELSASLSKDPNVLVSKCLDSLDEMIERGQTVPAGFSCWPGGGSAIVVPSAPTNAPAKE